MMSETSDLRSVARHLAILCLAAASLLATATLAAGCASNSEATQRDGAADEKVSGEAPSPEEDTPKTLPPGPDVEIGKARTDAPADSSVDAQNNADDAANTSGEAFSRSEVDNFMQKGPSYALTLVRVEPERVDGSFQGFKIAEMEPRAAEIVAPQLIAGDVITHINGVRMEKPDDFLNAWKLLSEVSQIRVDFVRDGTSQHAVWPIR